MGYLGVGGSPMPLSVLFNPTDLGAGCLGPMPLSVLQPDVNLTT